MAPAVPTLLLEAIWRGAGLFAVTQVTFALVRGGG
jgi:hypothetical protein